MTTVRVVSREEVAAWIQKSYADFDKDTDIANTSPEARIAASRIAFKMATCGQEDEFDAALDWARQRGWIDDQ